MKKVLFRALVTVALFFGTWYLLMQIDWMKVFKTEETVANTEEKLGELFWGVIKRTEKEYEDPFTIYAVDSLLIRICDANDMERKDFRIHLLQKDEVNAFAMPGNRLVIYTGLINVAKNPEELAGVICHELAHLKQNHVMLKLSREIGLATVVSMTAGGAGSELIKEAIKKLTSTAFDRKMESEADRLAVDYLKAADMDPRPFADFLYRMSAGDEELNRYTSWISTHPDSKERAEAVAGLAGDCPDASASCLEPSTWEKLKEQLKD